MNTKNTQALSIGADTIRVYDPWRECQVEVSRDDPRLGTPLKSGMDDTLRALSGPPRTVSLPVLETPPKSERYTATAPYATVPSATAPSQTVPFDTAPSATVRVGSGYNWALQHSPTTFSRLGFCERAFALERIESRDSAQESSRRTLKYLGSLEGSLGDAVHSGISTVLTAQRQMLNSTDSRTLKRSLEIELPAVIERVVKEFHDGVLRSWRETFTRGHPTRGEPRYREHVLEKHRIQAAHTAAQKAEEQKDSIESVLIPNDPPDTDKIEKVKCEIRRCLLTWHSQVFHDGTDAFNRDPHRILPRGGLAAVHPLLIVELEERKVSYTATDGLEMLKPGAAEMPFYEVEATCQGIAIGRARAPEITRNYIFKINTIIDLMYLTFTPSGDPRLVILDWKTNKLDKHSGRPHFTVGQQHKDQLKHYALYALKRYGDIFTRYSRQIEIASKALGITPKLPARLSPEQIFLADVYLRGDGLPREYRITPVCAADLDLVEFEAGLKIKLEHYLRRFNNIDPVTTELERWRTNGLEANSCRFCNQVPRCDAAPNDERARWPSIEDLSQVIALPMAEPDR